MQSPSQWSDSHFFWTKKNRPSKNFHFYQFNTTWVNWWSVFAEKKYLEDIVNKKRIENILDIENDVVNWEYNIQPYINDKSKFDIYTEVVLNDINWEQLGSYEYKKLSNKVAVLDKINTINSINFENKDVIKKWLGSYLLKHIIENLRSDWYIALHIYMKGTSIPFYDKTLNLFKNEWLIKDYKLEEETLFILVKL